MDHIRPTKADILGVNNQFDLTWPCETQIKPCENSYATVLNLPRSNDSLNTEWSSSIEKLNEADLDYSGNESSNLLIRLMPI